LNKVYWK